MGPQEGYFAVLFVNYGYKRKREVQIRYREESTKREEIDKNIEL